MPKPRKFERERSNLSATLDAIAKLPDRDVAAWGKEFDWSQIVECRSFEKPPTLNLRNAGEVLLRRRDARLNRLLLRPDMFCLDGKWQEGSQLKFISDQNNVSSLMFTSEDAMLHRCLKVALSISDVESAAIFERGLSMPNQWGSMHRFFTNLIGSDKKEGLFDNDEPVASLHDAVDFCEQGVLRHARYFKGSSRLKLSQFAREHLESWRHWMCAASLRLGNLRLYRHLHQSIGAPCTKELMLACLLHDRWDELEQLCSIAREKGASPAPAWPLRNRSQVNVLYQQRGTQGATNTPERVVEVALAHQSAQWKEVAMKSMAGSFELGWEPGFSKDFLPRMLAWRIHEWDDELRTAIFDRFPVSTFAEMVAMAWANAPQQDWQRRLDVLDVQNENALGLVSLIQTQNPTRWEDETLVDRLGQLLAFTPDTWPQAALGLGPRKEQVEASMQRHAIHGKTVQACSPSRARRM